MPSPTSTAHRSSVVSATAPNCHGGNCATVAPFFSCFQQEKNSTREGAWLEGHPCNKFLQLFKISSFGNIPTTGLMLGMVRRNNGSWMPSVSSTVMILGVTAHHLECTSRSWRVLESCLCRSNNQIVTGRRFSARGFKVHRLSERS